MPVSIHLTHHTTWYTQAAALLEQDPEPQSSQGGLGGTTVDGADVLQIEDSGDALDIDLDDPFQAQMLDISQPIVADEGMLKLLKQQVYVLCHANENCYRHS